MFFSRLCAYSIDMLLITFLMFFISGTYKLNPYLYDHEDAFKKYEEVYKSIDTTKGDSEELLNKMKEPLYDMEHTNIYVYIWYIVLTVFYFGIFQRLTGGQTLGKKLCRLKVVSSDDKDANLFKLLLHSIFVGSSFYEGFAFVTIIKLITVLSLSKDAFINTYFVVALFSFILEITYYIIAFKHKDGKYLNDIIAGVKTISLKNDVNLD